MLDYILPKVYRNLRPLSWEHGYTSYGIVKKPSKQWILDSEPVDIFAVTSEVANSGFPEEIHFNRSGS